MIIIVQKKVETWYKNKKGYFYVQLEGENFYRKYFSAIAWGKTDNLPSGYHPVKPIKPKKETISAQKQ